MRRSRAAAIVPLVLALAAAAPLASAAPLQLPPVTRATLKNGLTVLILPTHRLPLVDLALVCRAGAVYDPAGKEGIAGLTANLLTQGAGTRSAQQIAEDIAFVGGTLEADADAEGLEVDCEVLRKDFDTGLALFRDVIVTPTFPADAFERRRQETLGSLASDKDDPGTVADRALLPFVYGKSPLAHDADGWESSVSKLTRDDVVAFHRRLVTPDNATLAVVGDVEPKAALAAIEAAFKDWKPSGGAAPIPYAPVAGGGGRAVRIVAKPEVTQTQIRFACPGVARNHPDYFPIRVANTILGAGFTSRLVNEIRVTRGLTYSIRSGFTMHRNAGAFEISTFTRNATLRACVDAVLQTVQKLVDQGPSEDELAKAKRYLTGQFPLGLQAPDALAHQLLDIDFYGLDPRFIETFDEHVNAVTLEDCRRALKSYFCTADLKLLVVANPDSAKKALAGLGTAEVVSVP